MNDNLESKYLIEYNKISTTKGNKKCLNMPVDNTISLPENLRDDMFSESQHLCIQVENSNVDRNVNGPILRQEKTINHKNTCGKIGLLLSLMVNIALTIVIVLFICYKMDFKRKTVEEKHWTSLCVLENHKTPVCSDYSKHLQYLVNVMQTSANISKSPAFAQSYINITSSKESPGTKALKKQNTNRDALLLQDNQTVIEKSNPYLISLQLLFKRESRWNNRTENVRVSVTKKNRNGNLNAVLMTQLALMPDGIQTFETVHMIDIFRLEKGDMINIIVSTPSLLYECKSCNKITAIEVL